MSAQGASPETPPRVVAREAHRASYPDPVALRAGEPMRLTGREDVWDGWRRLWAVAEDGREGWVPDDLPAPAETCAAAGDAGGRRATATRDYGAAELDCAPGDALAVLERRNGWALCRDARGAVGWIPLRRLDV